MKIPCEKLAAAGYPLLGTPYRSMDCRAFIGRCLKDCGLKTDPGGNGIMDDLRNRFFSLPMKNQECPVVHCLGIPIPATAPCAR